MYIPGSNTKYIPFLIKIRSRNIDGYTYLQTKQARSSGIRDEILRYPCGHKRLKQRRFNVESTSLTFDYRCNDESTFSPSRQQC